MYNEVEYIGSLVKVDNGNIAAVTDGINTCINEYLYVISKKIIIFRWGAYGFSFYNN